MWKKFVQIFDHYLGASIGFSASIGVFSDTCGLALALNHNGDLFSCNYFVERDYNLENINTLSKQELVLG